MHEIYKYSWSLRCTQTSCLAIVLIKLSLKLYKLKCIKMQKLKQDRVVVCHAIVKRTKDPKELHA